MTDTLETKMDERCEALLEMACKPAELTKAIEAVTKWVQVKRKIAEGEGWGGALKEAGNGRG